MRGRLLFDEGWDICPALTGRGTTNVGGSMDPELSLPFRRGRFSFDDEGGPCPSPSAGSSSMTTMGLGGVVARFGVLFGRTFPGVGILSSSSYNHQSRQTIGGIAGWADSMIDGCEGRAAARNTFPLGSGRSIIVLHDHLEQLL